MARAYGVLALGGLFAKRWTFYIGSDGKILYIDRDVKPSAAGQGIAERLAALGVPRRSPPR